VPAGQLSPSEITLSIPSPAKSARVRRVTSSAALGALVGVCELESDEATFARDWPEVSALWPPKQAEKFPHTHDKKERPKTKRKTGLAEEAASTFWRQKEWPDERPSLLSQRNPAHASRLVHPARVLEPPLANLHMVKADMRRTSQCVASRQR
jgi:hypothetical protein